jgi:hypothetical protein
VNNCPLEFQVLGVIFFGVQANVAMEYREVTLSYYVLLFIAAKNRDFFGFSTGNLQFPKGDGLAGIEDH